jgi:predicted transposase YbfD/YdcC
MAKPLATLKILTSIHSPLNVVSAWSVNNSICLGQCKSEAKSNEITATPKLLDILSIKGSIMTIDVMDTQHAIAEQIIAAEAYHILPVKGDQKGLQEQVQALCACSKPEAIGTRIDKGHGRIETRRCEVFPKSIIKLTTTRDWANKQTVEKRYYISNLETVSNLMVTSATIGL